MFKHSHGYKVKSNGHYGIWGCVQCNSKNVVSYWLLTKYGSQRKILLNSNMALDSFNTLTNLFHWVMYYYGCLIVTLYIIQSVLKYEWQNKLKVQWHWTSRTWMNFNFKMILTDDLNINQSVFFKRIKPLRNNKLKTGII